MKRFALYLTFGLLMLSVPVQAAAENPNGTPVRDKWALVIGVGKFKDSSLNLQFADKDARDFSNFLTSKGHFAKDHVQVLLNEQATRETILDFLGDKWLPRVAQPDDLVVIYISSHGSPSRMDVAGANFLIAHDSTPEHLFATGISMQELASIIKERVHCKRVVLFLDACHSGSTTIAGAKSMSGSKGLVRRPNFDAEGLMQGTGQMVICSSEPGQVSWESRHADNGVFTRHLMDSLAMNGENTKLGDAYDHLKDQVQSEVLRDRGEVQTPVFKSNWQGRELLFFAPATAPRSAPILQLESTSVPSQKPKTERSEVPPNVTLLTNLAQEKMEGQQYSEASRLYESLRAVLESTIGRDTPENAECLTQLGWLYCVLGRTAEAQSLQRESVRINASLYGANSFYVARETTLLCNTLLAQRDFVEAEPIALKAVALWESLEGKDSANVLESLVNMANVHQHAGRLDEADSLLKHAEQIADRHNLPADSAHRQKLQGQIADLQEARRMK